MDTTDPPSHQLYYPFQLRMMGGYAFSFPICVRGMKLFGVLFCFKNFLRIFIEIVLFSLIFVYQKFVKKFIVLS